MSHDALNEMLRRRPFIPFRVRLSSGECHDVRHPEMAMLLKSRIVIADPLMDRLAICTLLHITSVEEAQSV